MSSRHKSRHKLRFRGHINVANEPRASADDMIAQDVEHDGSIRGLYDRRVSDGQTKPPESATTLRNTRKSGAPATDCGHWRR